MGRQFNEDNWTNAHFVAGIASCIILVSTIAFFYLKRSCGPNAQKVERRIDKFTTLTQLGSVLIIASVIVTIFWSNIFVIKYYSQGLVIIGLILMYTGNILLIWTLYHLGKNWTMLVSEVENHELVTSGPYRMARHPMYTCLWIWVFGYFACFGGWLIFICAIIKLIIVSSRIRQEEILLISLFGEDYLNYMQSRGAFCPFTFCDCGVDYNQERHHLLAAKEIDAKDNQSNNNKDP